MSSNCVFVPHKIPHDLCSMYYKWNETEVFFHSMDQAPHEKKYKIIELYVKRNVYVLLVRVFVVWVVTSFI